MTLDYQTPNDRASKGAEAKKHDSWQKELQRIRKEISDLKSRLAKLEENK